MAYLATLEGESITLDDLFNVNDYLGVRYFGVPTWNRIKQFACELTEKAKNHPTAYYVASLKNDPKKPSQLSCDLFGFNDVMGVCFMGDSAWNALKCDLDAEVMGSLTSGLKSVAKSVGKAATGVTKAATTVAKTAINAPASVMNYAMKKTPLKYTPTAWLYNKVEDSATSKARNAVKNTTQKALDTSSAATYALLTNTPLKYTPTGQFLTQIEKTKEKAGITSKGTAGVYESDAEYKARMKKAGAAASKAASAASAKTTAAVKAEKQAKALTQQAQVAQQQAQVAQQEQAAAEQALNVMENRVESKYAPIVMIGCFGLLALALLKNK